jgi:hypothetical protein
MPTGLPESRELWMTPEVGRLICGPWASASDERKGRIAHGELEQFINGDEWVVRWPPDKDVNCMLALLDPEEDNTWEHRIGQARIFGHFADLDIFIATAWRERSYLKADKKRWRDAKETSKTCWKNLFPCHSPFNGSSIHDYISNARLPF